MKKIWNYIDHKDWSAHSKYRVLIFILETIFAAGGFLAWISMKTWIFSTWDWMVCFICYPVIISWFVVFFYSCNHELHDGKP